MADALRSSMETIILLNMHSFIWESILFILYGTDKKSLRITVLSINHFDALLCGYSWACRWQTVHWHRAKVIAQRMPTMLRLVKKRSFFRRHIEFLPHHVNVRLKTIGWRLLTSGNLFNGIDLISFNYFQEIPTGWTAYFNLQRCLTLVEQERQHCWSTSVELWDNSFTIDLFFCMKTSNKDFVTLKISSGFCKKK